MHRYEPFHTKLWSDHRFKEKVTSPQAKLLFIYLFTNEELTATGIYELDLEVCQIKLNIKSSLSASLTELVDSGLIKYDKEHGLIWVVNRFKYIATSPKVIQSAINELKHITHAYRKEFITKYGELLKPYLLQLDGVLSQKQAESLLTEDTVHHLAKVYSRPAVIKEFLVRRGLKTEQVEDVVNRVFQQLERAKHETAKVQ